MFMYSYCYIYVFLLLCMLCCVYSFSLCCSVYCLRVNVYCTAATGYQTNCSEQMYKISRILTLEEGADTLFRKVGKKLPLLPA